VEYVGSSGVVVGVGVGVEVGVVEAAAGWGKQTAGAAAAATAAGAGLCLPLQVYEPAQWALSAVHLDELSDIQMPPSQCLHQKLPNITSRKHSKNLASRLFVETVAKITKSRDLSSIIRVVNSKWRAVKCKHQKLPNITITKQRYSMLHVGHCQISSLSQSRDTPASP